LNAFIQSLSYRQCLIKRALEGMVIFPFLLLGRLIAFISPLKEEYELFLFFPFYHTGGAEKVHANIAKVIGQRKTIIFFTRHSQNNNFKKDFTDTGHTIKDISRFTDNKWFYFNNLIYRGIISGYINRQQQKPVLLNGHSNFAYKIAPWIRKDIKQVELIHSFNSFSYIRIPFIPFYQATVMISRQRISDHLNHYEQIGVPDGIAERIRYIVNGVDMPAIIPSRDYSKTILKALYVGRGTAEKRVHLVAAIAKACTGEQLPVTFEMMGDVKDAISTEHLPYLYLHGNIEDANKINEIYNHCDILIISSSTEGFPLVIAEAMARGLAIIATPVGDIPVHIKDAANGFLFTDVTNEAIIIKEGVDYIRQLAADRPLLEKISGNNRQYALTTFGIDRFAAAWQQLLA
jgi:L-malate glycosyltransferase